MEGSEMFSDSIGYFMHADSVPRRGPFGTAAVVWWVGGAGFDLAIHWIFLPELDVLDFIPPVGVARFDLLVAGISGIPLPMLATGEIGFVPPNPRVGVRFFVGLILGTAGWVILLSESLVFDLGGVHSPGGMFSFPVLRPAISQGVRLG
jgi:hypothetical protein